MPSRSKSSEEQQVTQQDVADRRIGRSVVVNAAITAVVAAVVGWGLRHGTAMRAYANALTWGAMFACVAFATAYQHRELARGQGNRNYFRALVMFAATTGLQCVGQFFDGNIKVGFMIAGILLAIPVLFMMLRAADEQHDKVAD